MKNEVINIRVDEKTKLKLLQQSQYYNVNLSKFMLDTVEKACNLDVVQIWIHAYVDFIVHRNEDGTINHYKTLDGADAWSMSIIEDTFFSRVDLLQALNECCESKLPRMLDILNQWDEFVERLKLLGLWEEMEV